MLKSGERSLVDGVQALLQELTPTLAIYNLEKWQRLLRGLTVTKYKFTNLMDFADVEIR